jgi:hypothetical protein
VGRRSGGRVRTASLMAAAVAASGAALLHSGAVDPVLTAVAGQVAARTGHAQPAAAAPSPGRTARVAWSWDLGAPTWDATLPRPSRLTPVHRIDPVSPAQPAQPVQPRLPDGTPPDDGSRPYWYQMAATNPKVALTPMPGCPQYHGPSARTWMSSTPGKGSVTLTWWDLGDPSISRFEIGAFARAGANDKPSMTWTSVPARKAGTCGTVTATITGLSSGVGYDFWLESVNKDPLNPGSYYRTSRGRTEVMTIP